MTDTVTQEVTKPKEPGKVPTKLIVLPYIDRRQNRFAQAWREIKVIWAQCQICQEARRPGWWRNCPHQPYTSDVRIDEVTPRIKCNVCSEVVPQGIYVHCGVQDFIQDGETIKPTFLPQFNTRGIRVDDSVNAGRYLESARAKGAMLPGEMGIAAMCEFSRCFAPVQDAEGKLLPGAVSTSHGLYCNQDEAKLVALVNGREAVEIFDKTRQRDQLQAVSL
jgi:hypothetical protein